MVLNDPVWKHIVLTGKDCNRNIIATCNRCARTFSLKVGRARQHLCGYGKILRPCYSKHVDFALVREQFKLARGHSVAAVVAVHRCLLLHSTRLITSMWLNILVRCICSVYRIYSCDCHLSAPLTAARLCWYDQEVSSMLKLIRTCVVHC